MVEAIGYMMLHCWVFSLVFSRRRYDGVSVSPQASPEG